MHETDGDLDELYQLLVNAAFRFVSFRPRSEKEFRDFLLKKLQKRKINNASTLEKVIQRLKDLEYLDDRKFALWWVDQRRTHRPKGMSIMKQELKAKGIHREILDSLEVHDERDLANKAIEKKVLLWSTLPKPEMKKKLYEYLARRGFSSDIIYRVIDDILTKDYNTSA